MTSVCVQHSRPVFHHDSHAIASTKSNRWKEGSNALPRGVLNRDTPVVCLQKHQETTPNEAVISATIEEERLRQQALAKEHQVAASHRLAQQRVRLYHNIRREVLSHRSDKDERPEFAATRDPSLFIAHPSKHNEKKAEVALTDFDTEHVTCAINAFFVDDGDKGPNDVPSRTAAHSKMAQRRRLATQPPAEEEDELTEVTCLGLDSQRTQVDFEEDTDDPEPDIPPLLLTPGRSSAPSSTARDDAPPTLSTPRAAAADSATVRRARDLRLIFYPRLAAQEAGAQEAEPDSHRALSCRRAFADVERETARRRRQRERAEKTARRLKAEAEQRRRREEAALLAQSGQASLRRGNDRPRRRDRTTPSGADSAPPPAEADSTRPSTRDPSPRRFAAALRWQVRERLAAARIEVPPLCPCATSPWEVEPDRCAVNCPFYRDPAGLLRCLLAFLPDSEDK